ncbi:MAG: TonB-dependent receptor plug domain-containing protein [Gemmatimonadaceae bacterium]|nr:TonB-dependent receptor plug domain-containing protein [Gemmatimonadaceae bacterium]
MAVSLVRRTLVLLPLCVAISCRSGAGTPDSPNDQAYHAHVITSEAIARSGASDAWEVLKRLSTTARATESYDGEPQRLHPRRGHGSLYLRDDPMVYIDGVPLSDIRALRQIGAADIDNIQEMGSVEATAYFGTNSNSGVILIHSKSRPGG